MNNNEINIGQRGKGYINNEKSIKSKDHRSKIDKTTKSKDNMCFTKSVYLYGSEVNNNNENNIDQRRKGEVNKDNTIKSKDLRIKIDKITKSKGNTCSTESVTSCESDVNNNNESNITNVERERLIKTT